MKRVLTILRRMDTINRTANFLLPPTHFPLLRWYITPTSDNPKTDLNGTYSSFQIVLGHPGNPYNLYTSDCRQHCATLGKIADFHGVHCEMAFPHDAFTKKNI